MHELVYFMGFLITSTLNVIVPFHNILKLLTFYDFITFIRTLGQIYIGETVSPAASIYNRLFIEEYHKLDRKT